MSLKKIAATLTAVADRIGDLHGVAPLADLGPRDRYRCRQDEEILHGFDPLAHRERERCTVAALRAEAVDVDITPKSYGMPKRSGPPVAALPS